MKKKMKTTVRIGVRKNNSRTSDKAPYLPYVIPDGTIGMKELVDAMNEHDMDISPERLRFLLDSITDIIGSEIAQGHKVNTGWAIFEPAVSGSVSSAREKLDPKENKVYIKVTLSTAMRNASAKLEAVREKDARDAKIANVITPSLGRKGFNVLKRGETFVVSGRGFPADAEPILIDGAGEKVAAEVESVKAETLVVLAPATLAPGSGKLILADSSRRIKIV